MKKTLKIFALICCLVLTFALSSCGNWFSFVPNGTTTQTTITEPPHEHNFADADCLNPKTCECGETEGEALGHTPADDDGDCTTDVLCTACECVLVEKQEGHVDEDLDYICDVDGCDEEVLRSISTVDELVAAFRKGGKYQLKNDIDAGDRDLGLFTESLYLDLNNFTITTSFWNGIAVYFNKSLTIKNGTVRNVGEMTPAIVVYGNLNMYNCNVEGNDYWSLYADGGNVVVENSIIKFGIVALDMSEVGPAVVVATNNVTISDFNVFCGIYVEGESKIVLGFDPTDYLREQYNHDVVAKDNGDGTWTVEVPDETSHVHNFADADCLNPKTCKCGATEGEALGHTPADDDGDCTTEVLCTVCECVLVAKQKSHTDEDNDNMCDVEGCTQEAITVISTVEELVAAFRNGGKYQLKNDIDAGDSDLWLSTESLYLDLNNFTITTSYWLGVVVDYNATLTIKNGTVRNVGEMTVAIMVYGNLNMYNCNVEGNDYWSLYVYAGNAVVENSIIKYGIAADHMDGKGPSMVIATNNVTISDFNADYGICVEGESKLVIGFDPTDYLGKYYNQGVVKDNGDGTWTVEVP